VLQELAGHSNLATTQRYINLRTAMLIATVELVQTVSGGVLTVS
jgi:hypothetical protein